MDKIKVRDTIKEVLDRDCQREKSDVIFHDECIYNAYLINHPDEHYSSSHALRLCFCCHKHDDLAARIVDAIQETK